MQALPTNIYASESVREIDRKAIRESGIPGYTLMSRAGQAAVAIARDRYPATRRWQVICGAGNNGGDGFVIARLAADEGIEVSVLAMLPPDALAGDAAKAHADFVAAGGRVTPWAGELDVRAEVIVDAMLGSGLERDVAGEFAQAVAAINAHPAKVHAIDIPTGINTDTGEVMGHAVNADITTTFVGLKPGLFLGAGADHCGAITFDDLEIPGECREGIPLVMRRIDDSLFAASLRPRRLGAHKGEFGHVLVVAGGPGMAGAARLCGEAALRAGAGRVSVATHPDHAALISTARPELMSHGVASGGDLEVLLQKSDVVAFGPGLGQSDWAREMHAAVAATELPAVWDADALNWLARARQINPRRIITPHPGEAATLLRMSTEEIQRDRLAALNALVEFCGGIAVLKGAGTLISSEAAPFICTAGNPGMAAPGMGDALTGIIAALLAQGLSPSVAAAVGVELHARAGDLAARQGERGMLVSDLIAALRGVANP